MRTARQQYYVYLHLLPSGDPFYVGKGVARRARSIKSKRSEYHRRIVNKHGEANIEILMFPRESEAEAFADEVLWIKTLRNAGCVLCNMTTGGEGASGSVQSAEARQKIANANYGRVVTGEIREKIAKALRGIPLSEETKRKISEAGRGRIKSEETRRKLSNALRGRVGTNLGKKFSDEHRAKISAGLKGKRKGILRGPMSSEHKAKVSAGKMGHAVSIETRNKIAETKRGSKLTQQAKDNISAGRRRYFERIRQMKLEQEKS